jgi:hypothetical protein
LGVDGCSSGWVAVLYIHQDARAVEVSQPKLRVVLDRLAEVRAGLVDVALAHVGDAPIVERPGEPAAAHIAVGEADRVQPDLVIRRFFSIGGGTGRHVRMRHHGAAEE